MLFALRSNLRKKGFIINPQLVSDITALLNNTLPKDFYALDFTLKHYRDILGKLAITENQELFNQKKEEISQAIIDYFALSHQTIDLQISFQSCSIKKQFLDPLRSESFDRMLHRNGSIIRDILNRKSEFLPLPFLVSIPPEIRSIIFQGFVDTNESLETTRQITRRQIDAIFGLHERDIIFFLRGKISIRYHTPAKKIPIGADKRYTGELPELMEEMFKNYFPDGAWADIEPILGEVIEEKLNFSVIDNITFSKTFIPVFRSMIEILLLDILSEEDRSRIEGFTGFVLRQHFYDILLYTAKNLLEFVESRDKNAEAFIKYFSDEVVIDPATGSKIQKYAIMDSKQQRWNYSSIVSIMMQHKQSRVRLAAQKETVSAAQERVTECQSEFNVEQKNKMELADKLSEVETMIIENDIKLSNLKTQTASKIEEEVSLKSELKRFHNLHSELLKMKKNFATQVEIALSKMTSKSSELSRRQKKLDHEKKQMKALMEQNTALLETYDMITEAISIVLAKR